MNAPVKTTAAGIRRAVPAGPAQRAASFVRVPSAFLDGWLPRLGGPETKVFLVVCRNTLGRREPGANGGYVSRRRDWLSHALIVRRTGCGSEAVSKAVRRLVDLGLIVVEAADGTVLPTPEERRRHLGRLYYRLADTVRLPVEMWKSAPEIPDGRNRNNE